MYISEIILRCSDPEEMMYFYCGKLGFERISFEEKNLSIKAGHSIVTFIQDDKVKNAQYHFAFNIPGKQFFKAIDWASSKLSLLKNDIGDVVFDFSSWNAEAFYFLDPQNNIVEFIARHDLNISSEKEFSAQSITEVSEIGVPVDDVGEFYDEVNKFISAPVFDGDKKGFTAIGDQNGLFIVVPLKRNWYPTEFASAKFPLDIIITQYSEHIYIKEFGPYPYTIRVCSILPE
ncbi:hypothetical protein BH10BAC5_BH10BAC5_09550 [soil metagenome]